jgi:putative redox protein
MHLSLKRTSGIFGLTLKNSLGEEIQLNASPSIGGEEKDFRPMELVAGALAGCSSIDILNILNKQRLQPAVFEVEIEAQRRDEIPATFEHIHLVFTVSDDVPQDKVERAIQLSMEKYCSVTKILEPTCKITTELATCNPDCRQAGCNL